MIRLIHGDCLEELWWLEEQSVDLVVVDLPYGTTDCSWDSVVPFDKMWAVLLPALKPRAAVCMFGSEPFSSALRMSNPRMFKYDWIWEKKRATLFQHANKMPMKKHEVVSVFYKKAPTYHPQFTKGKPYRDSRTERKGMTGLMSRGAETKKTPIENTGKRYPVSVLGGFCDLNRKHLHPTQKPVALLEYLIKTYSSPGDTVLDFTMGSGSTGVAAKNLKRRFIGIEKNGKYFNIARKRVHDEHR